MAYKAETEFTSVEFTMTRGRLVATAASIIAGLSAFYCSLFYLPAYLNQSGIVRLSSHEHMNLSLGDQVTPVSWYSPYADLLRLRRGFFRAGQVIEIEYLLSGAANLNIEIKRCGGPMMYKIF